MSEEYIPFDKALADLKMTEEELKRLVSEDEIQAIRGEGGKIQLRREDVDALRSSDELSEELVFADEDDVEDDAGMVTAVLEDDSLLEEEETLDLSPDDVELDDGGTTNRVASIQPGPVRSRGRAASIRGPSVSDDGQESGLDKALVVMSCVLLVYGLLFAYDITSGQSTGATRWLSDMFRETVTRGTLGG